MKNPAKHYLLSLKRAIGKMAKSPELFVKRPGKDFTRKRKLDFRKTVSFLLTSVGKSLSNELLQFFSCKSSFPTVSAFIQQRDKLSKTAFVELFHSFSKSNIPNQTFKGYRLLAVDGSTLSVRPQILRIRIPIFPPLMAKSTLTFCTSTLCTTFAPTLMWTQSWKAVRSLTNVPLSTIW